MQHYTKGIVDLSIYVLLISSKNMVNFSGISLEATSVPFSFWMQHYIEGGADLSIYVLLISGIQLFICWNMVHFPGSYWRQQCARLLLDGSLYWRYGGSKYLCITYLWCCLVPIHLLSENIWPIFHLSRGGRMRGGPASTFLPHGYLMRWFLITVCAPMGCCAPCPEEADESRSSIHIYFSSSWLLNEMVSH